MWYTLLWWFHPLSLNESLTYASNSPLCSFRLTFLLFIPTFILLFLDISNFMSHKCPLSCSKGDRFSFFTNLFLVYCFMLANDIALLCWLSQRLRLSLEFSFSTFCSSHVTISFHSIWVMSTTSPFFPTLHKPHCLSLSPHQILSAVMQLPPNLSPSIHLTPLWYLSLLLLEESF